MWIEGFTLNSITLLALALAVGIVIDDAIVVLENIFASSTRRATSRSRRIAATKEIGMAVSRPRCRWSRCSSPSRSWRHRRSLPQELRPDDVVRHRRLAARQLHAHAHALRALAPRQDRGGSRTEAKKPVLERVVDYFYRPIERGYMAILRS